MRTLYELAVLVTLWTGAVVGVQALHGCSSAPEPETPGHVELEPIEVVEVRRNCIEAPPPVPEPITPVGRDGGCPFASCLDRESLIALTSYLDELQGWARRAWLACGPLEDETQNGGPDDAPDP